VDGWEGNRAVIGEFQLPLPPFDKDIPTDNWSKVKKGMLATYDGNAQLKPYRSEVDEIEDLLHIADREEGFRISSNASCNAPYETENTRVGPQNPEDWYASYNYPFEIIQFFLALTPNPPDSPQLRECADEKFVRKFLWMLAQRENVVPILSLASFYALSPFFHEINGDVDWGGQVHWTLPLPTFVEHWRSVSNELSRQITGSKYADLTDDLKLDFAKLLFIASLTETTTKNAFAGHSQRTRDRGSCPPRPY
jgi:hypothetical protein